MDEDDIDVVVFVAATAAVVSVGLSLLIALLSSSSFLVGEKTDKGVNNGKLFSEFFVGESV